MTEPADRAAFHAAARLSRAARDLLQSADELDRPADSYAILGNVLDAVRSLEVASDSWPNGTAAQRPAGISRRTTSTAPSAS